MLYSEDLDNLRPPGQSQQDTPNPHLYLLSPCHPKVPSLVYYNREDGSLNVVCSKCRRSVAQVAVANRAMPPVAKPLPEPPEVAERMREAAQQMGVPVDDVERLGEIRIDVVTTSSGAAAATIEFSEEELDWVQVLCATATLLHCLLMPAPDNEFDEGLEESLDLLRADVNELRKQWREQRDSEEGEPN